MGHECACNLCQLDEELTVLRAAKISTIEKTQLGAVGLKNAGYSLIELIVVVAILAVALSLVGLSINSIFALNSKECAKKIMSELSREKVAAMSKQGAVFMKLYASDSGVYIDTYENGIIAEEGIKVGNARVIVKYYSETNTSGSEIDSTGIIIAFNKTDGSLKTIGQALELSGVSSPPDMNAYTTKLEIMSPGASHSIIFWPQTGKFELTV